MLNDKTIFRRIVIPLHDFYCAHCYTLYQNIRLNIKDDVKYSCPECEDETDHVPSITSFTFIKGNNTLGSLAEKNNQKLGRYGVEDKIRAIKEENKERSRFKGKLPNGASFVERPEGRPFWREDSSHADLNLLKMNQEQTARYLQDGTRPIGV